MSIVLVPYIFIYLFILGVYFIFCNSKNSPCHGGGVGGEQDLHCFSKTKSSSPLIFDKDVNRTAMSLFFTKKLTVIHICKQRYCEIVVHRPLQDVLFLHKSQLLICFNLKKV